MNNSFFDLPKDWQVKTLGDVADINMGQSPSSSSYNDSGIGKYLIQGNADIKNRKTAPRTWTTEFPKVCEAGDIIMTVRAPVGAIARSLHSACLGRGVCAITSTIVNNDYLYHYLISYETRWAAIEQGSTFTAVNGKDIRGIEIPLPPLAEQQKIAEILSTVDEKIAVIDEQLAQTQELKKGLMQRLLTRGIGHTTFKDSPLGQIPESWEVVSLGQHCKLQNGYAFKSETFTKSGTPVIRISNVQDGKITIESNAVYYNGAAISPAFQVCFGEALIAMSGATTGKIGRYTLKNPGYINQRVGKFVLTNKSILNYEFLFQILHSAVFVNQLAISLTAGAQPNISSKQIESIVMPLPPFTEQHQIAEILTTVDDKIQVLTDKKTHYQELKRGLMQQLLTGQRRVKVAEPAMA